MAKPWENATEEQKKPKVKIKEGIIGAAKEIGRGVGDIGRSFGIDPEQAQAAEAAKYGVTLPAKSIASQPVEAAPVFASDMQPQTRPQVQPMVQQAPSPAVQNNYGAAMQMQGIKEEAQSTAAQAGEAAKIYETQADILAKREEDMKLRAEQKRLEEERINSEIDAAQKEVDEFKIQDPSMWGKSSTGGKIMMGLGLLLSAFGNQGQTARALASIDKAADDDIALQKQNLLSKKEKVEGKKGLLSRLYDKYKDMETAESMATLIAQQKLANQLQMISETAKSKNVQAQAKQSLGKLQSSIEEQRAATQLKLLELGAKQGKENQLGAADKQVVSKIKMADNALRDVKSAIAEGVSTVSLVGDNKYTEAARRFTEALGRLQSGGAINKDEEERFAAMLPSWKDKKEIKEIKLQKLQEELNQRLGMYGMESTEQAMKNQLEKFGIKEK